MNKHIFLSLIDIHDQCIHKTNFRNRSWIDKYRFSIIYVPSNAVSFNNNMVEIPPGIHFKDIIFGKSKTVIRFKNIKQILKKH